MNILKGVAVEKLEKIINYIIYCFRDEPTKLGKVKLAKILWSCEREFMYKTHKRLSNLEFIKLNNGPVPKKYNKILDDMVQKGIIHSFNTIKFDKKQTSFYSLIEPDMNDFQAIEISIIDSVVYSLWDKSANELSNMSHDSFWESTNTGDVMPVESVFMRDIQEPDENDIAWAMQTLKEKGLE